MTNKDKKFDIIFILLLFILFPLFNLNIIYLKQLIYKWPKGNSVQTMANMISS